MNVGSRGNKMRVKKEASKPTSEGKSVRFSRQMISDIFFIERLEKKHAKELFYSEKDIIGFQIDAMRKGERKARRAREQARQQGVARSNSDGKVASSSSRKDRDDGSSMGKKSKKSSKKKSKDTTRRRFSNDDAADYEPRTASEESAREKSRDPLDEKKRVRKAKGSSKRSGSDSSSSSDDSSTKRKSSQSPRESMTQEQLLEKAMHWRKSTNYREASDKLDSNTSIKPKEANTAIDPWTQDMLMTKAKKWGEAMANKVAASNPERKPTTTSSKTKQMAFLLARDAKESSSAEKISEEPPKPLPPNQLPSDKLLKEPPTKKPISSSTKQFAFLLAHDAKEAASNRSLEDLPLSDDEDDDVSVELSDLVMEANLTESMNMSQNDFLTEAIEKKQKEEEAANPLNKLRGIARSIMVSQAFQNLTMETEASK